MKRRSLVTLVFLAFLLSTPVVSSPNGPYSFTLRGINISDHIDELDRVLGSPDSSRNAILKFTKHQLRVGLSATGNRRVVSLTGEVPLEFRGKVIARIGQTPEQIHAVLGKPDDLFQSPPDLESGSVGTRVDIYERFFITVYYKATKDCPQVKAFAFSLSSREDHEYFHTPISEKKAPEQWID